MRAVGYNKTGASLTWRHPDYPIPSFAYLITIRSLQFGEILRTLNVIVKKEEDPFIFINLKGHECESLGITVSVHGEEEGAVTMNFTLPSCEFKNFREYRDYIDYFHPRNYQFLARLKNFIYLCGINTFPYIHMQI